MSNTITNLRLAKEHLFEKGWQKGGLGGINGPNCIVGALRGTPHGLINMDLALRVTLEDRAEFSSLGCFNDHDDTTFDDIVDLIDATIKRLEGAENV